MRMWIKTKTPLHIGNGERYGAMDAYLNENSLYRVNLDSVFKRDSSLVKRYIKAVDTRNFTELQSILKKGNVRYSAKVREKVSITRIEEEIHEYIKDSNGDVAYIPGSTLKGFLRTALIMKYLKDNHGKFSVAVLGRMREYELISIMRSGIRIRELNIWSLGTDKRHKKSKYLGERFEDLLVYMGDIKPIRGKLMFRYDAKYDIFKFLEIGDFYPVKYDLWVDRATIYTNGRRGAHIFIETVGGEFGGEIRLSPTIKTAISNEKEYPLLKEKMKMLGISINDLSDIKKAEFKMIKYILSAVEEMKENAQSFNKEIRKESKVLQGANIRIGFGTGVIYKTIWMYLVKNDRGLAELVLKNMRRYRARVDNYPKSHYELSDGRELGWTELGVKQ